MRKQLISTYRIWYGRYRSGTICRKAVGDLDRIFFFLRGRERLQKNRLMYYFQLAVRSQQENDINTAITKKTNKNKIADYCQYPPAPSLSLSHIQTNAEKFSQKGSSEALLTQDGTIPSYGGATVRFYFHLD